MAADWIAPEARGRGRLRPLSEGEKKDVPSQAKALVYRQAMQTTDTLTDGDAEEKHALLQTIDRTLAPARLTANVAIASFFAGANAKQRQQKREAFGGKLIGYEKNLVSEAEIQAIAAQLTATAKAPHLIYVDESGMDERDHDGYGGAPVGERVYDLKSGRRQARVKLIAGYRHGQLIAPFTIEGAWNRTEFETWLETCLIPVLQPGEGVMIDHATFQHGGRMVQLLEEAGCKLV